MALDVLTTCFMSIHEACCISDANLLMLLTEAFALQALDGFSLCLWQLGEANGALTGSNVFALLHRLSSEPVPSWYECNPLQHVCLCLLCYKCPINVPMTQCCVYQAAWLAVQARTCNT